VANVTWVGETIDLDPDASALTLGGNRLKLTSYRRLAAGIGLMGAGALALLAGPAAAHQWNGHPDAPSSQFDETAPAGPDGTHTITMTKSDNANPAGSTNSVSKSRPAGCDSNGATVGIPPYSGGTCNVEHVTINLSSPSFNGVANHQITALICQAKLAAGTEDGGSASPTTACDASNGRGLAGIGIVGSGVMNLDGSGNVPNTVDDGQCSSDPNLCGPGTKNGIQIDSPSCVTNSHPSASSTVFDGGLVALAEDSCRNPNVNATCPVNPSLISDGWDCIVTIAEFDSTALTPDDHVGYRTVRMKPPIPVSSEAVPNTIVSVPPTCNGGACPVGPSGSFGPIAPGVDVKVTGRRFPCRINLPDDPTLAGWQGGCAAAWTTKTMLVKRITTQLLEPSATVLSQTAGLDGSYTVTFDMPNVVGSGFADSYRFVPHSPNCTWNQGNSTVLNGPGPDFLPRACESPNHNASGIRLFQT
jgi:hypothetical protein